MGKAYRSQEKRLERKIKKQEKKKIKDREMKKTFCEVKVRNVNLENENDKIKDENDKIKEENDKIKNENDKIKDENDKIKDENDKIKDENEKIMEENKIMQKEKKVMTVNLMSVHQELKTLRKSVLSPHNPLLTSVSKDIIKKKHKSVAAHYNKLSYDVVELTDIIVGEGTFGIVQVGKMSKLNGLNCAVKSGKSVNYFNADHEASILQRLQGSIYVPHLFGILDGKLVMEYIIPENGCPPLTVYKARKDNFFNQTKWNEICHHLIQALVYLHSNSILHNDLKSNNVLLKSGFIPIIVDFGKATLRKDPETYKLTTSQMERYNKRYPHLAHELRNRFNSKTLTATDIYSLGYLFNFVADQNNELLQDLQKCMLTEDPVKRITSPEILKHFNHAKAKGYQ